MHLLNGIRSKSSGQGLVEYGLILALVSVVAVGALGGVGGKVTDTFNSVGDVDISAKIAQGYVPVATAEELEVIGKGDQNSTFGKDTEWEDTYTSGLGGKYILVSDIDLSGINFEPIGDKESPFTGDFDGQGYQIKNLTIDHPSEDYIGLFSRIDGATIHNVGLVGAYVSGRDFTGGLVGHQENSLIRNSSMSGVVHGTSGNAGGLVGYQNKSSILRSYSEGEITGLGSQVGGLAGRGDHSLIDASYSNMDVRVVKSNPDHLSRFSDNIGGLVGALVSTTVTNSYAAGDVYNTGWNTGGLSGGLHSESIVINSYASGSVSSSCQNCRVSGLIAHKQEISLVESSYYNKEASLVEGSDGGVGLSSSAMKDVKSYEGWDFDTI